MLHTAQPSTGLVRGEANNWKKCRIAFVCTPGLDSVGVLHFTDALAVRRAVRRAVLPRRSEREKTQFLWNESRPKGHFRCRNSLSCEPTKCVCIISRIDARRHRLTMKNGTPKPKCNWKLSITNYPKSVRSLHIPPFVLRFIKMEFQGCLGRICCSIRHMHAIDTRPIGWLCAICWSYELWKIIFPLLLPFGDNVATQMDWPSLRPLFCECSNYHFRRIDSVCVPLRNCVTESRFCLHRVVAVLLCVCEKKGLCVYDCRKKNVTVFCSHIVSHDTCRAKRFRRFLSLELSSEDRQMHTNWTRVERLGRKKTQTETDDEQK